MSPASDKLEPFMRLAKELYGSLDIPVHPMLIAYAKDWEKHDVDLDFALRRLHFALNHGHSLEQVDSVIRDHVISQKKKELELATAAPTSLPGTAKEAPPSVSPAPGHPPKRESNNNQFAPVAHQQAQPLGRAPRDDAADHGAAKEALRSAPQSAGGPPLSKCEEAQAFLRQILTNGAMRSALVQEEAEKLGIAAKTLLRARERLGIIVRRDGFGPGGAWVWSLPWWATRPSQPPTKGSSPTAPNKQTEEGNT